MEMKNMGLFERKPSFFYEKVSGRPGTKSVYKLKFVGENDFYPSH